MKRLAAGLLALALIPAAAACGSDSSSSDETQTKSAAATAASDVPRLDTEEQRALDKVRQEFTAYCADKTKGEPVGSAALAESLLDFGADTRTADGSTLGDALSKSRDELRRCGAKKLAKRLDTAIKAAA
jgi:hypothetical protein